MPIGLVGIINRIVVRMFLIMIKFRLIIAMAGLLSLIACQKSPPPFKVQTPEPHLRVAIQKDPLIIQEVGIERYLMGVLANETYASWPKETLMAQAVASRTYALYRLGHPTHADFDLTASMSDQIFEAKGVTPPSIVEAIQKTRGQALFFKDEIIPAFFHSCCGGYTERASHVWQWAEPYDFLKAKPDPHCDKCKHWYWEYTISREAFSEKFNQKGYVFPEGWFLQLKKQSRSPRIQEIEIVSPLLFLKPLRISGVHFRRIMGYANVKSTLMNVEETGSLLTFKGRGYGHGAGMCQWGSRGLALAGTSYEDILQYYYPETNLIKMY